MANWCPTALKKGNRDRLKLSQLGLRVEPTADSNLQLAKLRTELEAERRQLLQLDAAIGLRDRTNQLLQDQLLEAQRSSDKLKDQAAVLENQAQTLKSKLEDNRGLPPAPKVLYLKGNLLDTRTHTNNKFNGTKHPLGSTGRQWNSSNML